MAKISEPKRIAMILEILDKTYGEATTELTWQDPWQLLVAVILSAQATDVGVNKVTPRLFAAYPRVQDFLDLSWAELDEMISSINFHRNKAKSILGAARMIVDRFGGKVPQTMAELTELPGIARKSANVILWTAFGKNEGIAVDTHVARVSARLALTNQTDPVKIEQQLMEEIPQERWGLYSHQVILHGRRICTAQNPKCKQCPLREVCPAYTFYTKEPNTYFTPGDWEPLAK